MGFDTVWAGCSSALFMFIGRDCGIVSSCEPVVWQLLRRLLLLLQHCIATMEGRLCGCFCAALLLRRLSRGRCGAALQNTASVVADPAAVVRPHAIAAETALYTQPISAVEGLHHAEGVETAGHAEGAEHVWHACMRACVCAWDRRPDQRRPQHTFRSNQAVVRPHMRPSRCGGDGHASLFVMGGL